VEAIQEVLHSLSGIGEAKGRDDYLTGFIEGDSIMVVLGHVNADVVHGHISFVC